MISYRPPLIAYNTVASVTSPFTSVKVKDDRHNRELLPFGVGDYPRSAGRLRVPNAERASTRLRRYRDRHRRGAPYESGRPVYRLVHIPPPPL